MYHNFISKTGSVILQMMNNITKKAKLLKILLFKMKPHTISQKIAFAEKSEVKRYVLNRDVHCFDF